MVHILYGDEPQLLDDHRRKVVATYDDLPVRVVQAEMDPRSILEKLSESSLFGDQEIIVGIDWPIIKKANRNIQSAWEEVRERVIHYDGDNPLILVFHDNIDKRTKLNQELLKSAKVFEGKRLSPQEMMVWINRYVQDLGYGFARDGMAYLEELLGLWQDVTLPFLKTEMDRLALLSKHPKNQWTKAFLEEHMSDYGAKNIFAFKEALLSGNVRIMSELLPFMLSPKEVERAMSYVEGQLRLQLLVGEMAASGKSQRDIENYLQQYQYPAKSYPIKLAYEARRRVDLKALAKLLEDVYTIMRASRLGEGSMERFGDACLAYCYTVSQGKPRS